MFGITLATGLVVDDAIVVIENIERHMAEGEHDSTKRRQPPPARLQRRHRYLAGARRRVCSGCILSGTTGILFRQFALTIAFPLPFPHSMRSPWLRYWRNFPERRATGKNGGGCKSLTTASLSFSEVPQPAALRAGIQAGHDGPVFRRAVGSLYLVFTRVPKGFVPDEDQGYFIIVIQAPSGASLEVHEGQSENRFELVK